MPLEGGGLDEGCWGKQSQLEVDVGRQQVPRGPVVFCFLSVVSGITDIFRYAWGSAGCRWRIGLGGGDQRGQRESCHKWRILAVIRDGRDWDQKEGTGAEGPLHLARGCICIANGVREKEVQEKMGRGGRSDLVAFY